MPVEQGYERRIFPQATVPLPSPSPEAYGAGLGRELADTGEELHRRQLRAYQLDRELKADSEATTFARRFAEHRRNMDDIVREIRDNPTSPDYAEHAARVSEAERAAHEALLSGISDQRVRNQAERQLESYGAALHQNESDFAESQRIAKTATDVQQVTDLGANRISHGVDPDAFAGELKAGYAMIDGLRNVPPPVREKLRRDLEQTYASAYVNHLNDTNPQAALALIDAGAFDEFLTPEQLARARGGAMVEVRRADAQAAHEAAVAKSQLDDEFSAAKTDSASGIDVSDRLPALRARYEALGDSSKLAEIDAMSRDSAFARAYAPATPLAREQRIRELSAKDKPSAAEQAELHWLRGPGKELDGYFNRDPVGYLAEYAPAGAKPPAIDGDGGVAARAAWAKRNAAAYGRPLPLFSRNEVSALAATAASGPKGQLEVADAIGQLSGQQAIDAARQIAPSDAVLAQLVLLAPGDRRRFQNGAEARKGNRALVDGVSGGEALDRFNRQVGVALRRFPAAQRNAAFEAARNLYADWAVTNGSPDFDEDEFDRFVARGLGMDLGRWRGAKVLLPPGYDQDRFDDALLRYAPSTGPHAPRDAGGKPMSADDLRRYVPVRRPDGGYEFQTRDGGRQIYAMDGSPFVMGFPGVQR